MHHHTVTATEAARSLSQLVNKVLYQGQSFDIQRGKEIVARLLPPAPASTNMKIEQLNQLFSELPHLGDKENASLRKAIKQIRSKMKAPKNPWA